MSLVKLCVLFRPDDETDLLLAHICEKLGYVRSEEEKKAGLPHHMTIIGGGRVEEDSLKAVVDMLTTVIKPFSEGAIPKVFDTEICFLPGDIGIRLKFPKTGDGRYVITGNKLHNQRLLSLLRTNYSFDGLPRHVSAIPLPKTGQADVYRVVDELWPKFAHLIDTHKTKLQEMKLHPEIWVKRGELGWEKYA